MKRVGFFILTLIAVQCFSALTSPASAWEFSMEGEFAWTYEWYSQGGHEGFFGPYDVDRSAGPTALNLNFWNGGQFDTNITTGADARWSYMDVDLDPMITINEAIMLRAHYHLGTYGDPDASDYHTFDSPGTDRAFADGQWTMFWATAITPWGTFGVGKRPWQFGTGLQYDGSDGLSTGSMVFVAPFGPFDLGFACYAYRYVGPSSLGFGDPFDITAPVNPYFSRADVAGIPQKDFAAFAFYHNGPLEAGILASYTTYHIGGESALMVGGTNQGIALDSDLFHGTLFAKYHNGRFFFNGEAAWLYWTDRYSDPAGLLGTPNPRYVEQWRYMVETGAVTGPMKTTLFFAWTPGPDRRNFALIGKQNAAFVWHDTFDTHLSNFDVFAGYSFLFSYNYGSGLNAYNLSGDGYVRDAFVLAARIDYAVACNLNVRCSFFRAERTSHGYGWGCIGPTDFSYDGNAPDGSISVNLNGHPNATDAPNIPDGSLGWEVDAEIVWQLLDGFAVSALFGYWQPGKWFSYACINRAVANWNAPVAANCWGTRPDRVIDPVIGGQIGMAFWF